LNFRGALPIATLQFTLKARADRIDVLPDGRVHLLDYKSGQLPTKQQQAKFDVQLLLQAVMASRGGFGPDVPTDVARISFLGLGAGAKEVTTDVTDDLLATQWTGLIALITRYMDAGTGFTARRALFESRYPLPYDHLARFGEWDTGDVPVPVDVGGGT